MQIQDVKSIQILAKKVLINVTNLKADVEFVNIEVTCTLMEKKFLSKFQKLSDNVRVLYVSCGLKKRGFSVITKQTETKQSINY